MTNLFTDHEIAEPPPERPARSTDHPLYQEIEALINQGHWSAAQIPLEELLDLYPDDTYLNQLLASARTRSALLEVDHGVMGRPRESFLPTRGLKLIVFAFALIVGVTLFAGGFLAIQTWILPQIRSQRQAARINQFQEEAQTALASGDYNRAVLAYNELLALLPDDPQVLAGLEQVNQLRALASFYSEAVAEMEAHHWENALLLLQQIEMDQPGYRDVPARIQFVQEQQILLQRFNGAETAFAEENYEFASQEYEALRADGYDFQSETIDEHLFISYLKMGLAEEADAQGEPQKLQIALDNFEKALALRSHDAQAKGESQLLRLYLAGLDKIEGENWSQATADLGTVYETRPDFAGDTIGQALYDAYVAWGDEQFADGQIADALAKYEAAILIKDIEATNLNQKIALAQEMLAPPTPTPTATPMIIAPNPVSVIAVVPVATPTPKPLPYILKGMNVRNNCDGFGYFHGIVWSTYNLPMAGVRVQAYNMTTGLGPLVSNPTNADGVYQIIVNGDQIEGLWMVQVLDENNQSASKAWGQRLGGGCVNGAQELKADWQYILQGQ